MLNSSNADSWSLMDEKSMFGSPCPSSHPHLEQQSNASAIVAFLQLSPYLPEIVLTTDTQCSVSTLPKN